MKNCPNCGAVIDPYRVMCEYCGTIYFDWATWLLDGKPCFINYGFDTGYAKGIITTQAIPRLEQVEINDEPIYITDPRGNVIHRLRNNRVYVLRKRACAALVLYNLLFKRKIILIPDLKNRI